MFNIEQACKRHIPAVSSLVHKMYLKYASEYDTDMGKQNVLNYSSTDAMTDRFEALGGLLLVAMHCDSIIGMLEVRDHAHISLFFVDEKYFKLGIGRALFFRMQETLNMKQYSVNSSSYALPFYEKLGFARLSFSIEEKDGVHFYPMLY